MNPLLIIGAIAGAFLLGRKTADKPLPKPHIPLPSPIPLPLPPGDDDVDVDIPPELDVPTQTGYTDRQIYNAAAWGKLAFSVLVYPKGGDKTLVPPPRSASGITASPGCEVIAVGFRWWDRAGQVAKNLQAQGQLTAANLERMLLPAACRGSQGTGARELRAEMLERVAQEFGPIRNTSGGRRRRGGARWWMR